MIKRKVTPGAVCLAMTPYGLGLKNEPVGPATRFVKAIEYIDVFRWQDERGQWYRIRDAWECVSVDNPGEEYHYGEIYLYPIDPDQEIDDQLVEEKLSSAT